MSKEEFLKLSDEEKAKICQDIIQGKIKIV